MAFKFSLLLCVAVINDNWATANLEPFEKYVPPEVPTGETLEEIVAKQQCSAIDGWAIGDPDNIKRYARCDHGKISYLMCPGEKVFFQATMQCIQPRDCGLLLLTTTQKPGKTRRPTTKDNRDAPTEPYTEGPTSSTTESDLDVECEDFGPCWTAADHSDCNYYFSCVTGSKIRMQCPPNKHYDFIDRRCVRQEKAMCDFVG